MKLPSMNMSHAIPHSSRQTHPEQFTRCPGAVWFTNCDITPVTMEPLITAAWPTKPKETNLMPGCHDRMSPEVLRGRLGLYGCPWLMV